MALSGLAASALSSALRFPARGGAMSPISISRHGFPAHNVSFLSGRLRGPK